MKQRSFFAMCACSLLIVASGALQTASAQKKKDKDNVVGTIWAYTITHDGKSDSGKFRIFNHEVFKGAEKVGRVVPKDEDETKLIIAQHPPLNGVAVLRKVGRKPPIWKGTLVKENGSKWQMEVHIKDK